jgi:hypothetical protein
MYEREGFMSPDTLLEALVPFMDTGPNDPGAGALAHRAVRRKAAGEWLEGGGGVGKGGNGGRGVGNQARRLCCWTRGVEAWTAAVCSESSLCMVMGGEFRSFMC